MISKDEAQTMMAILMDDVLRSIERHPMCRDEVAKLYHDFPRRVVDIIIAVLEAGHVIERKWCIIKPKSNGGSK
jgi:hypothetical protein